MSGTLHGPFFSIIIPTLDEEKMLPNLLRDLSHQTYQNFEVFVVDGESADKTKEVALQFGKLIPRFVFLESSEKNVAVQRNLGAKYAHGEYLFFFDADIRIPRYYLEGNHYCIMKEHPDVWTNALAPDKKSTEAKLIINVQNLVIDGGTQLGIPYAIGASLGLRKKVFQKLDGFDSTIRFAEDTEIVRRAVKAKYQFSLFKDPQYIFSTRRYRKEGTLRLVGKLMPTFIASLINIESEAPNITSIYPMNGGSYYRKKRRLTKTLRQLKIIEQVIRRMARSRKVSIRKLLNEFNGYFTLEK